MNRLAWLCAALAALGCGVDEGAEGVRLRFSYAEGDTLRYAYHASGHVTAPDTGAAGEPAERSYEKRMRIELVAAEVTPRERYLLRMTYRPVADSASERHPPGPISFRLEMTPRGRVLDVRGVEAARPLFGDVDFQSYFEQAQPVFPDRPMEVGDSWTQETKVLGPDEETVSTSSTYVLKELTGSSGEPVAVIAFDGDIYLPVSDPAGERDGVEDAPVSLEQRMRVRGEIHFAHRRGVVLRVESDADATMTKVRLDGDRPVRRVVKIREESEMRLLEDEGRGGT
ncbi:MAG: DUF6263 family protein [Gemmatimonadota bacterium]|nr:DUF6263 family protein [Gemmatimonadota bacterium]